MRRGRWDEAAHLLAPVEAMAHELDDKGMLVWVWAARGEVALAEGQLAAAESFAQRAVELAEQMGSDPDKAVGLRALGRVLAHKGEFGACPGFLCCQSGVYRGC